MTIILANDCISNSSPSETTALCPMRLLQFRPLLLKIAKSSTEVLSLKMSLFLLSETRKRQSHKLKTQDYQNRSLITSPHVHVEFPASTSLFHGCWFLKICLLKLLLQLAQLLNCLAAWRSSHVGIWVTLGSPKLK